MSKRIITFIISLLMVLTSGFSIFAQEKSDKEFIFATEMPMSHGEKNKLSDSFTVKNKGKVIVIDINRTSLENFENIKFLKNKMDKEGYVGLMNIRGDKGYDDTRNYASFGATGRANINRDFPVDFRTADKKEKEMYEAATGQKAGKINLMNINDIDLYNQTKGDYKSKLGYLADSLISDKKKVAVLGNSDYINADGEYLRNRDFCLSAMDSKGRNTRT